MSGLLSLLLPAYLIAAAIAVAQTRDLLGATIIFASYSLIMAVVWQQLQAPDVAITEAAIGAGVTTLLFLAAIARTRRQE
ncbi:MAG: hydrogenase subunit MbhD domain-containing protein [Bacillota bacterium]